MRKRLSKLLWIGSRVFKMNLNIDLSELEKVFDFDYLETYSFQRGSDYEKIIQNKEELYHQFINRSKLKILSFEENQEMNFLSSHLDSTQFLFDKNNALHFSAEKIKKFFRNENESKELIKIFKTKTKKIPSWMCAPVYRDAIVFYDRENQITEVLNICFSCEFIQNSSHDFMDTDESVYESLKKLLLSIGHQIETD